MIVLAHGIGAVWVAQHACLTKQFDGPRQITKRKTHLRRNPHCIFFVLSVSFVAFRF